jgi:hypothetical protein
MVSPTLSPVPDPRTDRLTVRPANRTDMRTTDNLFDSMRKRDHKFPEVVCTHQ